METTRQVAAAAAEEVPSCLRHKPQTGCQDLSSGQMGALAALVTSAGLEEAFRSTAQLPLQTQLVSVLWRALEVVIHNLLPSFQVLLGASLLTADPAETIA